MKFVNYPPDIDKYHPDGPFGEDVRIVYKLVECPEDGEERIVGEVGDACLKECIQMCDKEDRFLKIVQIVNSLSLEVLDETEIHSNF